MILRLHFYLPEVLLVTTYKRNTVGNFYLLKHLNSHIIISDRIRRTGEILTNIRTLKMYSWEHIFSSWLMETRSSEVKHLSVWYCYCWQVIIFFFLFTAKIVLNNYAWLLSRRGSIWMRGVYSFGPQHQLFSLCSHLDSLHWWGINLTLQWYIKLHVINNKWQSSFQFNI